VAALLRRLAARPVGDGDGAWSPAHRVFERRERGIIAGVAQIFGLGLDEILVAVADRRRHVDIFDGRLAAERREHGADQVAEAARRGGDECRSGAMAEILL